MITVFHDRQILPMNRPDLHCLDHVARRGPDDLKYLAHVSANDVKMIEEYFSCVGSVPHSCPAPIYHQEEKHTHTGCKIEYFVETDLRKLCVILPPDIRYR